MYLAGMGLEKSDLEALRTQHSLTPAHPEFGHTPGIEISFLFAQFSFTQLHDVVLEIGRAHV